MSEWWTYRPSDFLMFSPRSYWRLFELANAQIWPLQLLIVALALAWLLMRWRRPMAATWARLGAACLGACWAWVAWAFLHQRFAAINWPADGFAVAFAIQALGLAALATVGGIGPAPSGSRSTAGVALAVWSVLGQPLIGVALGRPWTQSEVIAVAPDPTVIAMFAYLLLVQAQSRAARVMWRCLWIVPMAWCVVGSASLWTMGSPQAWILPAAVFVAAAGVRFTAKR
jgi:hypothetical protein